MWIGFERSRQGFTPLAPVPHYVAGLLWPTYFLIASAVVVGLGRWKAVEMIARTLCALAVAGFSCQSFYLPLEGLEPMTVHHFVILDPPFESAPYDHQFLSVELSMPAVLLGILIGVAIAYLRDKRWRVSLRASLVFVTALACLFGLTAANMRMTSDLMHRMRGE